MTDTGPKVFLNYLSFDANYVAIADPSQTPDCHRGRQTFVRITTAAKETGTDIVHERMYAQVVVKQAGYMYIYYSNEDASGNYEAYFDDFTVTHTKFKVYKAEDYYPFGLAMDGNTYTDPYRYGYQGQYSEKDATTGLNEFELRMYEPRFGRWISPDPYGQFWSSYVGMGNMPHTGVDPDGGFTWTPLYTIGTAAIAGGIIGGLADKENPARGAAIGFLAGAAAGYGLSQINFSSLKGMELPVNIEKIALPAANYASIQLPSSMLRPIPYGGWLPSITSIFTVLNSSPQPPAKLGRGTPWMSTALGEYNSGVKEEPIESNSGSRVDVYLKYAGVSSPNAWCASFAHWCFGQNGIKGAGPKGEDWLNWGVKLQNPKYGAISVFKTNHIGFFMGKNADGTLKIIHGNWSNMVKISSGVQDPIYPSDIKEYRFPQNY